MNDKKLSVIAPLLYSDIFSFPLTVSEIRNYSQTAGITELECRMLLQNLSPSVSEHQGYYFLSGKESSVRRRKRGKLEAEKKYQTALRMARVFAWIPTVLYVGLSGSVAVGSARPTDDIDLFVITRKQTLFITRLLLLSILFSSGKKRGRQDTRGTNKICLNMLIDETRLAFPRARHDLYTAREIVQMLPLLDRESTQIRFFRKNQWLKKMLPNTYPKNAVVTKASSATWITSLLFHSRVEQLARSLQLFLISRHTTSEIISSSYVAFHPRDYRQRIMAAYTEKTALWRGYLTQQRPRTIRLPDDIDKEKNIFYTA